MTIGPKSIMAGKGERAQSSAEFVVVVPMLLILLFLMIEFGWMLKNYIVVTNVAREVARCAAVNLCEQGGTPEAAADLAVMRIGNGAGVHRDDIAFIGFDMYYKDDNGSNTFNQGDSIVVCIESPSRAVTPLTIFAGWAGVLPNPFPLRAREEMRVEIPYVAISPPDPDDPLREDTGCDP